MSKISEETIENAVVSKENTDNVISTKSTKKRTIKNITKKTTNSVVSNSTQEETISSNSKKTNKNTKKKRTLCLKIEKSEKTSVETNNIINNLDVETYSATIPHVVDTSINQNSPFFYEPSVFEKFNINITSVDNENDSHEESSQIIFHENNNSEQVEENISENIVEQADENILENIIEQTDENISENIVEQTDENILENIVELEELENFVDIEDIIDTENSDISENIIDTANTEDVTISTDNIDIENTDVTEDIDSVADIIDIDDLDITENIEDMIDIDDIDISENSETLEQDNSSDVSDTESLNQKEIEKNPIKNVASSISNSVVGKFFDSSIPNITQSSNSDSTFTKIKKSIFSNISPIFKKITFEEVNMINSKKQFDESDDFNNENLNITDAHSDFSNNLNDNNNFTSVSEVLNNSHENEDFSFSTKSVDITTDIKSTHKNTESTDYESDYQPIITSENISDEDIENELYEELLNNSEIIDDEENILDSELIDDDIEEILEDSESIDDEEDNLDIQVPNIEDINLTENTNSYNDDSFSIESYFGLNNIYDFDVEQEEPDQSFTVENEDEENNIDDEDSNNSEELDLSPDEFEEKFLEDNNNNIIIQKTQNTKTENSEVSNIDEFSKLIENFNKTISSLSERIATLEAEKSKLLENLNSVSNKIYTENSSKDADISITDTSDTTNSDDINIEDITLDDIDVGDIAVEDIDIDDIDVEDINLNDIDVNDINVEDVDLQNSNLETTNSTIENNIDADSENSKSVEDILSDAFNSEDIDDELKNELLEEVLSSDNEQLLDETSETTETETIEENILDDVEDVDESFIQDFLLENIYKEDLEKINSLKVTPQEESSEFENEQPDTSLELTELENTLETKDGSEPISDFFTIIDSLSKTISELEESPDIKNSNKQETEDSSGKAINILINKDDIFSISILNETYEIVADFDGISVLSENLHLSTPKNNFFVQVGEKYIEIHNYKTYFIVNTNFEDVQFANAINNVSFAKKNNKIELNIKESFKLASANNTLELSMLNTTIADMSKKDDAENTNENSICDNRTLLISEETQKVYLPYTIEDVMKKLNSSDVYQTAKEVIENEYTVPLSTFKMPIISRFKEAYRFMRVKEKSSVYAALDLALELMFNSDLNPAIIRAAKDLKELNIYLDCLYENEVDKFDCFKIVYKVLPKIK